MRTFLVVVAIGLILAAVFVGYAAKLGEAERLERVNPGQDCTVVRGAFWWDVACKPATG